MYYQFNNFTGRLIGSNNIQPYYPISPRPLDRYDPPKIIHGRTNQKLAQSTSASHSAPASTTVSQSGVKYGPVPEKLKLLQKHYQIEDGVPVWLKGGTKDKIWLGLACTLLTLNLTLVGHWMWNRLGPQ